MKITFSVSGGLAGLMKVAVLDTATLDEAQRGEVEALVARSRIAETSERSLRSSAGRDLRTYEITVEDAQGAHTWSFDDATVPSEAAGLLGWLRRRSRPSRP
jgi:hypothetical protein